MGGREGGKGWWLRLGLGGKIMVPRAPHYALIYNLVFWCPPLHILLSPVFWSWTNKTILGQHSFSYQPQHCAVYKLLSTIFVYSLFFRYIFLVCTTLPDCVLKLQHVFVNLYTVHVKRVPYFCTAQSSMPCILWRELVPQKWGQGH